MTRKGLVIIIIVLSCIVIISSLAAAFWYLHLRNTEANVFRTSPGDKALDLLVSSRYDKLLLEFDFVPGFEPDSMAIELLKARLEAYLHKRTVKIVRGEVGLTEVNSTDGYDIHEIFYLEKTYRDHYPRIWDGTFSVYILYLNARYRNETGEHKEVLGSAYHGSSVMIFKENIIANSPRDQVRAREIETAVLIHEFGHLLGLVNIGYQSELDHEDPSPSSRNHCIHRDCVMYYSVETSRISLVPTDFCSACQADLEYQASKHTFSYDHLHRPVTYVLIIIVVCTAPLILIPIWCLKRGRYQKPPYPSIEDERIPVFWQR